MKSFVEYLTESAGQTYTVFGFEGDGEESNFFIFNVKGNNLTQAKAQAYLEKLDMMGFTVEDAFADSDVEPTEEVLAGEIDGQEDPGYGNPVIYGVLSPATMGNVKLKDLYLERDPNKRYSDVDNDEIKRVRELSRSIAKRLNRNRDFFSNDFKYWENMRITGNQEGDTYAETGEAEDGNDW